MYHITSEKQFNLALSQMVEHLMVNGYLFLTDLFAKEDCSPAEHVCFHNLQAYKRVLSERGCRILSIYPMYGLLNGMLFDWIEGVSPKLRSGVRKIEEWAAPLLYRIDDFCIPKRIHNLKLMVVKRYSV